VGETEYDEALEKPNGIYGRDSRRSGSSLDLHAPSP